MRNKRRTFFLFPYSAWQRGAGRQPELSFHSLIIVIVAAWFYFRRNNEGYDVELIIVGEDIFTTSLPSKKTNTAELMKESLVQKGVPRDLIRTYAPYNGTNDQMAKLKALVGELEVYAIAHWFHLFRIGIIAKRLGLNLHLICAGEWIDQSSEKYHRELKRSWASPKFLMKMCGEIALIFITLVDKRGYILKKIGGGKPRPPLYVPRGE